MNITSKNKQLTLQLEEGALARYRSLRETVATGVYQRGLTRVAGDLDMAPSNLSVQVSEDPSRHFSIDSLERYLEKTGDFTPIYYLVEKFLADKSVAKQAANDELAAALAKLAPLMRAAGVAL